MCDTANTPSYFYEEKNGETRLGRRQGLYTNPSSFGIIAIRCDDELCTGKKNLNVGQIYQLLDGYTIQEEIITKELWRKTQDVIYDDFSSENTDEVPHVQFSAIVGKNGSGKSSLVELMMRIINNFSTVMFGEINGEPAANRLHYVENVMATVWFASDSSIYKLVVNKHLVQLIEYIENSSIQKQIIFKRNDRFIVNVGNIQPNSKDSIVHAYSDDATEIKKKLEKFFYTLVSNYSIYAYNTNDFEDEVISLGKKREISGGEYVDTEEDHWLHSLFHKNDGYKVPIGITPLRKEGDIDINNEKELSKERLVSLMITNKDYRVINNHLRAEGINVMTDTPAFGYEFVSSKLKLDKLGKDVYDTLKVWILSSWEECTGHRFTQCKSKVLYEDAIDYIVYKTLKVSKQYREHNEFYELLKVDNEVTEEKVKQLVKGESDNHSHITRKIFQTIAYLVYDVYELADKDEDGYAYNSFTDIYKRWGDKSKRLKSDDYTNNKAHIWSSAVFPPPFCEYEIRLYADDQKEPIAFDSLSSGERQEIFSISSILYHLENLNSIKDDEFARNRIFYPNVNVVLEEIELYFHPEMQRTFVKKLLEGIHAINLKNLRSVNFILVTHSPYVLSDIPRTNILALDDKSTPKDFGKLKTFGANIHDMLRSSFFLKDGANGAYAQWMVKHLSACLKIHQWAKTKEVNFYEYRKNREDEIFDFMERYTTIIPDKKLRHFEYAWFAEEFGSGQMKFLINLIDEPVLHNALMHQYHNTFGGPSKEEKREELMCQLKALDEDDTI